MDISHQDAWFVGVPFESYVYPDADYDAFCLESLNFAVTGSGSTLAVSPTLGDPGPAAPTSGTAQHVTRSSVFGSRDVSTAKVLGISVGLSGTHVGASSARSAATTSSSSSSPLMSS